MHVYYRCKHAAFTFVVSSTLHVMLRCFFCMCMYTHVHVYTFVCVYLYVCVCLIRLPVHCTYCIQHLICVDTRIEILGKCVREYMHM